MKKFISELVFVLCLSSLAAAMLLGCTTTQQKTTYNALATIEATASSAYTAYVQGVIKGQIPTNNVPQVSQAYNGLQKAIAAATVLDQAGTNYLVSSNLTAELTAFVNLATTATK